jgi:uncharacterized protein (TIGR00369 family)
MTATPHFEARRSDYARSVRDSFGRQGLMGAFGAQLLRIEPGTVEIDIPFSPQLTQQDGFFHAGVGISVLDTACGYAAFTLMAPGTRVLTVELKVNLLAPATGDRLRAVGQVVRPGRTLTVCRGDAYAASGPQEKQVATILATMIAVPEER